MQYPIIKIKPLLETRVKKRGVLIDSYHIPQSFSLSSSSEPAETQLPRAELFGVWKVWPGAQVGECINGIPIQVESMQVWQSIPQTLMSTFSSKGILSLKKDHDAYKYPMKQTGLSNITWVPMDHQNHPQQDGWRRSLQIPCVTRL